MLPLRAVPLGQRLEKLTLRFHVQATVVDELDPVLGLRVAVMATHLVALRLGLAEELDKTLAVLVLRFVGRHAEHVAQVAKSAGEPVLIGDDHGVHDHLERDVVAVGGKHNRVERHAVVPDDLALARLHFLERLGKRFGHLFGLRVRAVPDAGGFVVDGVAPQQNLAVFRITEASDLGEIERREGLKVREKVFHGRLHLQVKGLISLVGSRRTSTFSRE